MQTTPLYAQALCFRACFLQLGRIEAGSYSHLKWTVPELVWKRTETTSSAGSRFGCLVCTQSAVAVFTPAKMIRTKGEINQNYELSERILRSFIPTLTVFALDNLSTYDIFSVVDPNVQVGVKTTSVCRTFDLMKGHSIGVIHQWQRESVVIVN